MDLNSLKILVKIVDEGSFTKAADSLDLTKPTVSRKINELEEYLGVKLINRTNRSLSLTDEGDVFYSSSINILKMVNDLEFNIAESKNNIQGKINISMPIEVGQRKVIPIINKFLSKYPDVEMSIELVNTSVDIVGDAIDLYIHVGELSDSNMIAKYLYTEPSILVASKIYLNKNKPIVEPKDLFDGHYKIKTNSLLKSNNTWILAKDDSEFRCNLPSKLQFNTLRATALSCVDGLGIALLPRFICDEYLQNGELVRVLSSWEFKSIPVNIIYSQRKLMPKRIRLLIEYLCQHINNDY
ncbi:TPA: LysR family transcriptional regulator [Photobacterium damselae]